MISLKSIDAVTWGQDTHFPGGLGAALQSLKALSERSSELEMSILSPIGLSMNEGEVVRAFVDELRGIMAAVAAAGGPVSAAAPYLARGIETLETATDWLLQHIADDKRAAAAAASPYLRLFGFVAGAALLARSAVVAQKLINGGEKTPSLPAKITVAKFFATAKSVRYGLRRAISRAAGTPRHSNIFAARQ